MDVARRVVELGRAARNGAAVKNRQPLAEVAVAAPAAERAALERLRDIVTDELNVKELRLVTDADELLDYALKPNLKLLGPRLGKQVGAVGAALRDGRRPPSSWPRCAPPARRPLALADGEQVLLADERGAGRDGRPRRQPGRERRRAHRGPGDHGRRRRCATRASCASSSMPFNSRAKTPIYE